MNPVLLSDREKAELRGPVKTVADEWSTTVFDREGKIVEWRGNTLHGNSERTYSYDQNGKLIRISGSSGDHIDEFRYDVQGRMKQIRRVPARPERRNSATDAAIVFEAVSEGHTLTDGGTVETSYNERGQPVERQIVDGEGILLSRILYTYDASGRLSEERLIIENLSFPKAFCDQIPAGQRAGVFAQLRAELEKAVKQTGLFGNAERTYIYDDEGRLVERHMRLGPFREDQAWSFNSQGEMIKLSTRMRGFPDELGGQPDLQWTYRYSYEYDDYGNWTSRVETCEGAGGTGTRTRVRHLTYHS